MAILDSDDVEDIQVGRLATLIHADISDYARRAEERVIDRVVALYRAGDLTDEVLLGS